ncbi:MAG TPA: hypothetical protein VF163_11715, partial [Micromonosporaceae bacterium]
MRTARLLAPLAGSRLLALLAGLALLLTGCVPLEGDSAASGPGGGGQGKAAALAELDGLTVAAWSSMASYSRDRFHHWNAQ